MTREQMIDEATRRVMNSNVRSVAFSHLLTRINQAARGLPIVEQNCFECAESVDIMRAEFRHIAEREHKKILASCWLEYLATT